MVPHFGEEATFLTTEGIATADVHSIQDILEEIKSVPKIVTSPKKLELSPGQIELQVDPCEIIVRR